MADSWSDERIEAISGSIASGHCLYPRHGDCQGCPKTRTAVEGLLLEAMEEVQRLKDLLRVENNEVIRSVNDIADRFKTGAMEELRETKRQLSIASAALRRYADDDLWALDGLGRPRLWEGNSEPTNAARRALREMGQSDV